MFKTLANAGVNIQLISTSEVKVSCAIDAQDCDKAIATLCETFGINTSPITLAAMGKAIDKKQENTSDRVQKDISATLSVSSSPVRGVALDLNQARLAIRYVPDRPGMAAQIFGLLAEQNISVDMIIQSQRCRVIDGIPRRDIAFTVSQADAQIAQLALQQALPTLGYGEVLLDPDIAKVSVVGAGMIGQPGVAARMFDALAQNQINIQMITTSEIKISCVVAQQDGVVALQAIHKAFGLAGSKKIQVPA
jgi:aspartate kinase